MNFKKSDFYQNWQNTFCCRSSLIVVWPCANVGWFLSIMFPQITNSAIQICNKSVHFELILLFYNKEFYAFSNNIKRLGVLLLPAFCPTSTVLGSHSCSRLIVVLKTVQLTCISNCNSWHWRFMRCWPRRLKFKMMGLFW